MARLAHSLETLRAQIDTKYPQRSKVSDGWIGDPSHAASKSDHNPNAAGVVTALDLTHDPAHGFDSYRFAETLRQNEDPRIKYVISNHRIFSSELDEWHWRPYLGENPHDHHVHVSVLGEAGKYDDPKAWKITRAAAVKHSPPWTLQHGRTVIAKGRLSSPLFLAKVVKALRKHGKVTLKD